MKKFKLIKCNGNIEEIQEYQLQNIVNENAFVEKFLVQFKEYKCELIGIENDKLLIAYKTQLDMNGVFGFKFSTKYNCYIKSVDIDECIKVYCRRRIINGNFDIRYQENYYNLQQIKLAIS